MSKIIISLVLFSLFCIGVQSPVLSQNKADIRRLLAQGYYWSGRGQLNLAESAWKKVLSIDPGNKEARDALKDISEVNLETMVDQKKLNRARQLASDQHYEESLRAYEEAFNGGPPTSALSAEYYETLAGTERGWKVAMERFESLVETYPSNPRYAFTLAKLKTYREETRRAGISTLMDLSRVEYVLDKEIREEALAALREALIWLDADERDTAMYHGYLHVVPEDKELRRKLSTIIHGDILEQAYDLLNGEKLGDAAQIFNRILEIEPNDADALEGLGFVRLKQKQFNQAENLFSKAIEVDPSKSEKLRSAHTTAKYWSLLKQARYTYEERNFELAEELIRESQNLEVDQMEGQLLLAAILVEQEDANAAIQIYREIIENEPHNQRIVESILMLLLNEGDEKEALRVASEYDFPKSRFKQLKARLESERLRSRANEAILEGGHTKAILLLQEARLLYPNDPWINLDLSKLYLRQAKTDRAYGLFDELLRRRPDDIDVLYAKAIFCAEANNWLLGMSTLERIPQNKRKEKHVALQRNLWSSHQKFRVEKLLEQGDVYNAELIAEEVRRHSEDNPEILMTYAEILFELDKTEKALTTVQQALAMSPVPDTSLDIQYAGILLQLNKTAELRLLLDQLQQKSNRLTEDQHNQVESVRKGLAIRQAYELREEGDVVGAYNRLLPWVQRYPNDPDIIQIAALLYTDVDEYNQALKLFQKLLVIEPSNMDARGSAVSSALALKDFKTAQLLVDQGRAVNTDSSRLYAMRGRLFLAKGDHEKAAESFRTAIDKYLAQKNVRVTDTFVEGAFGGPRLAFAEQYVPLSDAGFPFEPLIKVKMKKMQAALDREVAEPYWIKSTREELGRLEAKKDMSVRPGFKVRNRSGADALDELTELEAPFRFTNSLDYSSQVSISATPVALHANDVDGSSDAAMRFGTLALDLDTFEGETFEQDAEGLALAASYQATDWSFDIGSTPLGFDETSFVGGIEWTPSIKGLSPGVTIERRAVTESLLSYAGTNDPQTGETWGGVTRTGLGLSLTQDKFQYGLYGKVSAYSLKGKNVKDNTLINLNGGVYWKTLESPDKDLTVGVHLSYMHYEHSLRYYTLGHGGYFSPQRHISIVFPIKFDGNRGPLNYRLSADIGMQHHREDSIAYYPENSVLQTQLEVLAATDQNIQASYNGNTDTGAVYNLRAEFDYKLNKRLLLGGGMFSGHANNYDENSAFLFVRYSFGSK